MGMWKHPKRIAHSVVGNDQLEEIAIKDKIQLESMSVFLFLFAQNVGQVTFNYTHPTNKSVGDYIVIISCNCCTKWLGDMYKLEFVFVLNEMGTT